MATLPWHGLRLSCLGCFGAVFRRGWGAFWSIEQGERRSCRGRHQTRELARIVARQAHPRDETQLKCPAARHRRRKLRR